MALDSLMVLDKENGGKVCSEEKIAICCQLYALMSYFCSYAKISVNT